MNRFVLGTAALVLAATPAFAHKMLVSVTVTDRAVHVSASYEGGEFVPAGARVVLRDNAGTVLAEASSDETGECRLPRPAPGIYSVSVDDRQGHLQKETIVVREHDASEAHTSRSNRWLMAALGVGLIAGITVAVMRIKKPPAPVSPP